MKRLAPSILSADFSRLGEEVEKIERGGADLIHVDIMDGHFVPNISFGPSVMKSLLGKTGLPFDVHLMIADPDRYIKEFVTENTEFITVHQEACVHLHRTLDYIKSFGVKAGVALNPATSLSTLEWVLEEADLVLVMGVNPGFGGQRFIPSTLGKIRELSALAKLRNPSLEIEMDGGATLENAGAVWEAGARILVAGSSVFGGGQTEERIRAFKAII